MKQSVRNEYIRQGVHQRINAKSNHVDGFALFSIITDLEYRIGDPFIDGDMPYYNWLMTTRGKVRNA